MSEDSHSNPSDFSSERLHPSSAIAHENVDRARKAAEALFAPKRPTTDASRRDSTGLVQQGARKPRILGAVMANRTVVEAPAVKTTKPSLQHRIRRPRKRVPASHLARLRTCLKYGMTIGQAADVYGVSVSDIERIARKG
jgi:hypothetical protein